eukprot:GEMP01035180.1.p1 GENE.GEMP01035180.1~~GEMP01035180.1.p1  ORF type:complete len:314 (+),score=47.66 GEMP01035180.1:122-1063(+)
MLLTAWILPQVAYGWAEHATMLVAQIAKNQLEEDGLSFNGKTLVPPGWAAIIPKTLEDTDDLLGIAVWMDIHSDRFSPMWRYQINTPFEVDGTQCVEVKNESSDMLLGASNAFSFLRIPPHNFINFHPDPYQYSSGYWLRVLVSIVSKLHHPLFNFKACSRRFPQGDHAGKNWTIQSSVQDDRHSNISNLRKLWDFGGGLYTSASWPLSSQTRTELETDARYLRQAFPKTSFQDLGFNNTTCFEKWHDESVGFAENIYNEMGAPYGARITNEYLGFVKHTAQSQIALAGYRLANVLKTMPYFVSESSQESNLI